MTLNFELNLDRVKLNRQAKYLCQRSFNCSSLHFDLNQKAEVLKNYCLQPCNELVCEVSP